MATRTIRKQALKNTTATVSPEPEVNPRAVIGGNQPVELPLTEAQIKSIVLQAVADETEGNAKRGTATQRIAAAMIGEHALLRSKSMQLIDLDQYDARDTKPADKNKLASALRANLLPKLSAPDLNEIGKAQGDEAKADKATENRAPDNLFTRGLKFAAALVRAGVPMTAFNAETGKWLVQFSMLLKEGWMVLPHNPVAVELDEKRGYLVQRPAANDKTGTKFTTTTIQASITQFNSVHGPVKPDNDTVDAGQGNVVKVIAEATADQLAANVGDFRLIEGLLAIYDTKFAAVDDGGKEPHFTDQQWEKVQNLMEYLTRFRNHDYKLTEAA